MQHTLKIFTCSYLWLNMETPFVSKHSTDFSAKDTWKKLDILNNSFLKLSDCKLVTEQFSQGWNTFPQANATTKAEWLFFCSWPNNIPIAQNKMLHLHNTQNKQTSYKVAKSRRVTILEAPLTEILPLNVCKARKKTSQTGNSKEKLVIIPHLVIKSAHYIAASQCTYKLEDFHLKKRRGQKDNPTETSHWQVDVEPNHFCVKKPYIDINWFSVFSISEMRC